MNNEYMNLFEADMREHLDNINECLLELENTDEIMPLVNELFRSFHTMKSSTAAMGFNETSDLIHKTEDLLYEVREGRLRMEGKIIQLIFLFHDFLENALHVFVKTATEEGLDAEYLRSTIESIIERSSNSIEVKAEQVVLPELEITEDHIKSIKDYSKQGFNLYLLAMKLVEDCPLKDIRIWMNFRELNNFSKVIFTVPYVDADEIANSKESMFEEDVQVVLFLSELEKKDLEEQVEKAVSEVATIYISSVCEGGKVCSVLEDDLKVEINNMVKEIEENANIESKDDANSFIYEVISQENISFVNCILNNIKSANESLVGLDSDNADDLSKVMKFVHSANGMASFIDLLSVFNVLTKVEEILDYVLRNDLGLMADFKELFKRAFEIVDKVCGNVMNKTDEDFSQSLISVLNELKAIKPGESEVKLEEGLVQEENLKDSTKALEPSKVEFIKDLSENQEVVNLKKSEKSDDVVQAPNREESQKKIEDSKGKVVSKTDINTNVNEDTFMKVSSEKINGLVDLMGELMILHSQHKQEVMEVAGGKSKIINNMFRLERITKQLHDTSMSLRMQPLKSIFQRLRRVVRDTSIELEKQVEVVIKGENTEIDRSIAERIFEPLMHLVRNAIAHGIEDEKERKNSKKSGSGTLSISAFNKVGNLYIEIKDDGRGLDREKLLEKAIQNGVARSDENYTDEEVYKFIFAAGFSTQEEIDNISGRGVGLNVVEEEVLKLRGRVDVESVLKEGCKFTIKLPINNATMTGTVINIQDEKYILPTMNVREVFKPKEDQWVSVRGRMNMLRVRNETVSLVDLNSTLGLNLKESDVQDSMVVILEMDKRLLAMPVSQILGKQEIVVKPLSDEFKKIEYSEGVTILGDGRISLILDINYLFKEVRV